MQLQIDLGQKTYEIVDADGHHIGEIQMNPSDIGLVGRWKECQTKINEFLARKISSPEELMELDRLIKAQLDYAFGSSISDVVFHNVSSLATCEDGKLVLETVMEALTPVIQQAQMKAMEESAKRIAHYTADYDGSERGLAPGQTVQTGDDAP